MRKALILGAAGQVARQVIDRLSTNEDIHLTLYLRNVSRLKHLEADRIKLIEGDLLDIGKLQQAMVGQDIVYVNINGQEDVMAKNTVSSMQSAGIRRLIFIAALGIYNEVPGAFGKWNEQMIGPILERYKKAASLIEASGLDYTILRPTWYTNNDEVDYILTEKGQQVTGTEISRKSVADLIVRVIEDPSLHIRQSLGMEKEGTDGDKPTFMS